MAYNLQPLLTILQQILNPEQKQWILDDHSKPQLESLLEKSSSLKQILEKSSVPKIESLESQIRDAAHKAEDIIESNMVDQVLCSRPGGVRFTFSTADDDHLQKVIKELDAAMEQVVKLMAEHKISSTVSSSSSGASSSADLLSSKSIVVGVDEDLLQLKDRLTGMQSQQLKIVPIVGMGGIGKTTLARKLYNDPLVSDHFDTRAWITISQDYNVRSILLGLLDCVIGKQHNEFIERKDNELKDVLYKNLYERRYLVVLDDMWSTDSWKDIRRCFSDCNNGSRIVITTRESDVAKYADSQSLQHQMQLLNKSESWNLLHQTVFGEEIINCPDALEGIGRKIASDCGGLPLAINVIGGLLAKAERSRDVWEHIAKDVRAAIAETGDQFSNILSLSYNHLPNHLRPCFLYMGAFPEDHEIKASRLVRLWVAEGFLKADGEKSLEEEAEVYLKALVERNLVLVRDKKGNGKAKSYGIHDLLRDLCMRKANEEEFLHVKNSRVQKGTLYSLRRVSAHTSYRMRDMYASAELMSLARSFICTGLMSRVILSPIFFALRLLRVLDVFEMPFSKFPTEMLELVNLRFLAVSFNSGDLPNGISRLWNLQTFIARSEEDHCMVSSEIWEMSELRHLMLKDIKILIENDYKKTFVQKKLQTISTIYLDDLIERGFLGCIPNIKNMGILCGLLPSGAVDLRHLHKLETLKCLSDFWPESRRFPDILIFPFSLRKFSVRECAISQKFLTTLSALPNLEVLKIHSCNFENEAKDDEEWDAATQGDEFRSLQFLLLESLDLVRWRADETNFPRLRQLVIRGCSELEEIPSGIGEISTLQLIELYKCSPSAVASARQIQEVQQSDYENYDLQLSIL